MGGLALESWEWFNIFLENYLLNLENVHCANKDTREFMLKDKRDLFELELKWERVHDIKGKKYA